MTAKKPKAMTPELAAIIARIEDESPEAAAYLRANAKTGAKNVDQALTWSRTPHNYNFWHEVHAWILGSLPSFPVNPCDPHATRRRAAGRLTRALQVATS